MIFTCFYLSSKDTYAETITLLRFLFNLCDNLHKFICIFDNSVILLTHKIEQ